MGAGPAGAYYGSTGSDLWKGLSPWKQPRSIQEGAVEGGAVLVPRARGGDGDVAEPREVAMVTRRDRELIRLSKQQARDHAVENGLGVRTLPNRVRGAAGLERLARKQTENLASQIGVSKYSARLQGLRGSTFGPASPGRVLSDEERAEIAARLKASGKI